MNSTAQQPPPVSGTRPEGTRDEREAAARVREMFSGIASRYDFLNHLLSLSFDRLWRRRTARRFRHILARRDARVLDLCCGTGDLAFALARVGNAAVWGSDFAHPMLVLAHRKGAVGARHAVPVDSQSGAERNEGALAPEERVAFVEADALTMPFPEASFDLVTAAFGFRNLANYQRGLGEILRLLKPGGEVGILEFSEPRGALFGPLYRFYFRTILPRIGGAISGSGPTYAYLPSSVGKFPQPEELQSQMQRAGFAGARFEQWTGGVVTLHTARKT